MKSIYPGDLVELQREQGDSLWVTRDMRDDDEICLVLNGDVFLVIAVLESLQGVRQAAGNGPRLDLFVISRNRSGWLLQMKLSEFFFLSR